MADPQACYSSRQNSSLSGKDKLAGGTLIEDSNTHTPTIAMLCAFTLILALAPLFNNELFQQFIKAYLDNQNQNQAPLSASIQAELREHPLKASLFEELEQK